MRTPLKKCCVFAADLYLFIPSAVHARPWRMRDRYPKLSESDSRRQLLKTNLQINDFLSLPLRKIDYVLAAD